MRIKTVEFAGAIARLDGAAPGDLVQVAFSGRSNVGKSSLINRLLGRTRTPVAKVSSTPGKTQQINFFRVRAAREASHDSSARPGKTPTRGTPQVEHDFEFFLVDLPGYGYARVPLDVRAAWKPLIERYLTANPRLAGVVQLIDARHGPTRDDLHMVDSLAPLGVPALFVLTKIDKLKATERARQIERWTMRLGAGPDQVLPFSARTGIGREALLDSLDALLTDSHRVQ